MWPRKRLILVAVLAALVLAGVAAGIAFAQTGSSDDNSGKSLLARVATILGIDQQKVEDAFNQAQRDMQSEALDTYLKGLVDKGTITQQQADQYKTWRQARPNMPAEFGFRDPGGFGGRGGFRGWAVPPQQTSQTTQ